MKHLLIFYLFIVFSFSINTLFAQEQKVESPTDTTREIRIKAPTGPRYLALDIHKRFGKVKRLRFYRGNEFIFQLKGSKERLKTEIESVSETDLGILGGTVPLKNIDKIIVTNPSWFVHAGSVLFPIAGLGYFTMDMLNPAIDDQPDTKPFTIHREAIIISGSLILTGIILRFLKKRVFKINNRRVLRPLIKF